MNYAVEFWIRSNNETLNSHCYKFKKFVNSFHSSTSYQLFGCMKPNTSRNYKTARIDVTAITTAWFCESQRSLHHPSYLLTHQHNTNLCVCARAFKWNGMNWECFTIGSSAVSFLVDEEMVYTQRFSNGSENFKLVEIYVPFLACQVFVFICYRVISHTHVAYWKKDSFHLFRSICLSVFFSPSFRLPYSRSQLHGLWMDVLVFVYFPFLPQKFIKGNGRLWCRKANQ